MLTAADDALGAASRRLHLWWVVGYTLLVACASLYPFGFDGERLLFAAADGFSRFLDWRDPTRRDTILNLLAYLPVGIGAALALPARLPAAARLALATATGAALSLAIELLQFASPVRVPSIADWTLNVAATAGGATAGLAVARLPALSMSRRLRRLRVNPSLALLILVWIASHAAPFLPRRPRAIRGAPRRDVRRRETQHLVEVHGPERRLGACARDRRAEAAERVVAALACEPRAELAEQGHDPVREPAVVAAERPARDRDDASVVRRSQQHLDEGAAGQAVGAGDPRGAGRSNLAAHGWRGPGRWQNAGAACEN
jgi:VanZ family protein